MRIIDARGHRCPVPTLKLQKALAAAAPGDDVRLIADDPMARIDVPHFVGGAGHEIILTEDQPAGAVAFTVRKRA
jgi:tRNA 2-thiouridine synthesizing protein A